MGRLFDGYSTLNSSILITFWNTQVLEFLGIQLHETNGPLCWVCGCFFFFFFSWIHVIPRLLSSLDFHLTSLLSLMISCLDFLKAILCGNWVRDSIEELLCSNWYGERHSVGELYRVQSVPEEKWPWCMLNSYLFSLLFLSITHFPGFFNLYCWCFKSHFSLFGIAH